MTIPLGAIDDLVDTATVAATINARAGWSATVGNAAFAARFLCVNGYPNASAVMDAKTAAIPLVNFCDVHADWFQGYGGVENAVIWNNTLNGAANNLSQVFRNDGIQKDMSVRTNVWMPQQAGQFEWGNPNHSHVLFCNNTTTCWMRLDSGCDSRFVLIAQNLIGGLSSSPADGPQFRDNAFVTGTVPSGANYSGNFTVSSLTAVLANWPAADYTPTGALLNNLKTPIESLDPRMRVRPTPDAIGAWTKA